MITRRQIVRLALTVPFAAAARAAAQEPARFYVVGFVKTPGSYALKDGMTVAEGIAIAGGLTDRGSVRRLQVVRKVDGKERTIEVSMDDRILANDTIRVPRRMA